MRCRRWVFGYHKPFRRHASPRRNPTSDRELPNGAWILMNNVVGSRHVRAKSCNALSYLYNRDSGLEITLQGSVHRNGYKMNLQSRYAGTAVQQAAVPGAYQFFMAWFSTIGKAALLLHAARAAIVPELQSIIWKYEGNNFWASLDLNAETFALESPAGSAPDALAKRDASGEYQACTLLTLDGEVTEAAIQEKFEQYQKIEDDVWSTSQVRFVLFSRDRSLQTAVWPMSRYAFIA